jgi:sigma-B regulation protein RsbU (phosphoserine phosphatase)
MQEDMLTQSGYFDSVPCGIFCFTDTGTITIVNQTLVSMLGYDEKNEITGRNIESLLPISGRIFYQTHLFPILKLHGRADEIFLSVKKKNTENLSVMCNAVRHEHNGSHINECILVPVTQRGKYEEELLKAKKQAELVLEKNEGLTEAKKKLETYTIDLDRKVTKLEQMNGDILQFSKIISHDLQEHIRRIAIYSDKIKMQGSLSDHNKNDLEYIRRECIKLRDLSINLDKYMSLNIHATRIVSINLNEVMKKSIARLETGQSSVDLIMQGQPLPSIEGYEDQIESLFYYLFQSAFLLHELDTPVSIIIEGSVIQQNSFKVIKDRYRYIDYVRVTLINDGQRIDLKKIQSLFTIEKTTDIQASGLGFGLAFCQKIVNNHYGHISIEPNIEKGNKVVIFLPVVQTF